MARLKRTEPPRNRLPELSAAARAGDLTALCADAEAAGWELRLKDRGTGTYYRDRCEFRLIRHVSDGAAAGPDMPDDYDSWWWDRRECINAGGRTLPGACHALALSIQRFAAGPPVEAEEEED